MNLFLEENHPYLRPCICRGDFKQARIILAGINPATPITPAQMSLEAYQALIGDYECFMEYYKESRRKAGKSPVSRTRQGISAFVDWVNEELGQQVIESDVCTYPTKSVKELDAAPRWCREAGIELFWEVLCKSRADVLILYGARAFRDFLSLVCAKANAGADCELLPGDVYEEGIDATKNPMVEHCTAGAGNFDAGMRKEWIERLSVCECEQLEKISPVATLQLGHRRIAVYVARHFMYYGKAGASYEAFKEKLKGRDWKKLLQKG